MSFLEALNASASAYKAYIDSTKVVDKLLNEVGNDSACRDLLQFSDDHEFVADVEGFNNYFRSVYMSVNGMRLKRSVEDSGLTLTDKRTKRENYGTQVLDINKARRGVEKSETDSTKRSRKSVSMPLFYDLKRSSTTESSDQMQSYQSLQSFPLRKDSFSRSTSSDYSNVFQKMSQGFSQSSLSQDSQSLSQSSSSQKYHFESDAWNEDEIRRMKEAVGMYWFSWDRVAKHVRTKNKEQVESFFRDKRNKNLFPTKKWSNDDMLEADQYFNSGKKDFAELSAKLKTKTPTQIRNYYMEKYSKKL